MHAFASKRRRGLERVDSDEAQKRPRVAEQLTDGGSGAGLEKHNDSGRFDVHLSEASGFNTPKKLQQQQPPTGDDEALIRGSALKRASPKGFTPQKLKDTIELLPNKFATLLELFGALQTVYVLLMAMERPCTFQSAKRPVEETSGRTFLKHHLMQMVTVFPDALQVIERLVSTGAGSASKQLCTIITMPLLKGPNAASRKMDLKQQFADLLVEHVRRHQAAVLREAADDTADKPAALPSNPESVPDIQPAELPRAVPASPSLRSPATPSAGPKPATPSSSARKPPLGPRSARTFAKRLTFAQPGQAGTGTADGPAAAANASASVSATPMSDCAATAGPPASEPEQAADAESRIQYLKGGFPISQAHLEKLEQNAKQKAAHFSPAAKAARVHASAESRLAKSHLQLKTIFGTKGPNIMPKEKLVQRMLGRPNADETYVREMEAALDLLLQRAPEFAKQEYRPEVGHMIRINRGADDKAIRAKLAASVKKGDQRPMPA